MDVLVKNDGGSLVRVTVLNNAGELLDLSSKSAHIAYTIGTGTLQKRAMTVLNQNTDKGKAVYQFMQEDLDRAGELEAEVIINDDEADRLTTEKFRVRVRARKV